MHNAAQLPPLTGRTTIRQPEGLVTISKAVQIACQLEELLGDEMHDFPFPLNTAVDLPYRRPQHDTPALLKQSQPYHDIGRAYLVLDGNGQDALGRPCLCRTSTRPAV